MNENLFRNINLIFASLNLGFTQNPDGAFEGCLSAGPLTDQDLETSSSSSSPSSSSSSSSSTSTETTKLTETSTTTESTT